MNEVLEVLMYLFEKHMEQNCQIAVSEKAITTELEEMGFPPYAITKALSWLNELIQFQNSAEPSAFHDVAMRVYLPEECVKLNEQARGLLLRLEQLGILNSLTRELVIDRLMALDMEEISSAQVKWVALMVLFNQPNKAAALACMERLVLGEELGNLH